MPDSPDPRDEGDDVKIHRPDLVEFVPPPAGYVAPGTESTDEEWSRNVRRSERAFDEERHARRLAERVLDRPNADPDDDLGILARQLIRALGRVPPMTSPDPREREEPRP